MNGNAVGLLDRSAAPPLRVARTVADTGAEGPGRRFAIWVQGCSLHCLGCCNPEMFAPQGGRLEAVDQLAARVCATPGIEGLTLLGGEPFEQPAAAAALAEAVRGCGLTVMVFSGYTLVELCARREPAVTALLAATDLLVDGRFRRDQPEPPDGRRWIGSRNQVLHALSDRYQHNDPRFAGANTVEIRFRGGAIEVNGWPAAADALLGSRRRQ